MLCDVCVCVAECGKRIPYTEYGVVEKDAAAAKPTMFLIRLSAFHESNRIKWDRMHA
jgi:hypothetical protein